MKHGELRNQLPSVETIPAKNVNQIIYGCCMSIVVVNITGSCTLGVLKTINSRNVVMGSKLLQRSQVVAVLGPDKLYFSLLWNMEIECDVTVHDFYLPF